MDYNLSNATKYRPSTYTLSSIILPIQTYPSYTPLILPLQSINRHQTYYVDPLDPQLNPDGDEENNNPNFGTDLNLWVRMIAPWVRKTFVDD